MAATLDCVYTSSSWFIDADGRRGSHVARSERCRRRSFGRGAAQLLGQISAGGIHAAQQKVQVGLFGRVFFLKGRHLVFQAVDFVVAVLDVFVETLGARIDQAAGIERGLGP